MAVQDRLDDILQARSLPNDLIAPGHLPAKRLRRLIRNPDLRQKAACIELGEDAGVDRIGLDLRMSDDAHLLGVCDHDFLDVRRDHRSDRGRVTGRFDNNSHHPSTASLRKPREGAGACRRAPVV